MLGELSEKQIENLILSYLSSRRILAFKVDNVGIFDQSKGIYRRKNSIHRKLGIADILGIYEGRPFAIEVKSKSGRLSQHQREFLNEFKAHGGISIMARSIEDVEEALKQSQI